MTFDPIKPGGHATGERLLSAQVNQLNADIPYALDGRDGGTYDPASALSVAKFQCPTVPATGNAVTNKTYTDDAIAAAVAAAVASVNSQFAQGGLIGTASNLSGISAVNIIDVNYIRYLNTSVLGIYASVTGSASAFKSFRLNMTALEDAFDPHHVIGCGTALNATTVAYSAVSVEGPAANDDYVTLTWNDTATAGHTINVNAVVTYYAQ